MIESKTLKESREETNSQTDTQRDRKRERVIDTNTPTLLIHLYGRPSLSKQLWLWSYNKNPSLTTQSIALLP